MRKKVSLIKTKRRSHKLSKIRVLMYTSSGQDVSWKRNEVKMHEMWLEISFIDLSSWKTSSHALTTSLSRYMYAQSENKVKWHLVASHWTVCGTYQLSYRTQPPPSITYCYHCRECNANRLGRRQLWLLLSLNNCWFMKKYIKGAVAIRGSKSKPMKPAIRHRHTLR